jgi:hypothetical protein
MRVTGKKLDGVGRHFGDGSRWLLSNAGADKRFQADNLVGVQKPKSRSAPPQEISATVHQPRICMHLCQANPTNRGIEPI